MAISSYDVLYLHARWFGFGGRDEYGPYKVSSLPDETMNSTCIKRGPIYKYAKSKRSFQQDAVGGCSYLML
jgi:hypothetical protein